jgi:hypothetical protein
MNTDYLSTNLLPALGFNRIRLFEEQEHTISDDDLRALGQIFVTTNMHHDWAAGLLHRHHTIQDGSIMMHELDRGHDICRVVPLESRDPMHILPNSFFLNSDNKFQPSEYDIESTRTPLHEEFLRKLLNLFLDRGLGDLLAIIPNPPPHSGLQDAVEYELLNGQGTICVPRAESEEHGGVSGLSVTTGWSFCRTNHGDLGVNEIKTCKVQPSGYHKRLPTPEPK